MDSESADFTMWSGERARSASTASSLRRMGSLNYKTVTIFKEHPLGRGSFGAVYKAMCDDLPCAAKVLHPSLVDPFNRGIVRVQECFEQECMLLDSIRHPNIVLYLGMHTDPDTRQTALLMELLDESLTHMLDSSKNALPYHIQVNICHDVSLAVAYLHSQNILHRDLSSNNVLMIARRKAKVTDFGVSRVVDLAHHSSTPLSLCPGTKAYMPPEALNEPSVYSEKIDVFSLGVIIIQLLTRLFPSPTAPTQEVQGDRYNQGQRLQRLVSETERRKNHIDLIDPNHPLQEIIMACLIDDYCERPDASQLCQMFAGLKQTLTYDESRHNDHLIDASLGNGSSSTCTYWTNGTSDISDLKKKLYEKEKELKKMILQGKQGDTSKEHLHVLEIEKKKEEIAKYTQKMKELQQGNETLAADLQHNRSETLRLQEQLSQVWKHKEESARTREQEILRFERVIGEQRRQIEEKDTEIRQLKERLTENERVTADFQRTLQATQQQASVSSPTASSPTASSPTTYSPRFLPKRRNSLEKLEMRWRPIESAPSSFCRGSSAYHDGNVYLAYNFKMFAYSTTSLCWNEFPTSPQANGSLIMINEFPTIIGGEKKGQVTNNLVSLMGHTSWIESFPKMPTARAYSSAVTSGNHVIVAGGSSSTRLGKDVLTVVEVMEISELECLWFSVSSLCHPLADTSAVIYQDQMMLIGGTDCCGKTLTNLKCSIEELLFTKTKNAINGHQEQSITGRSSGSSLVWRYLTDSKLWHSTGVVVKGHLLAIGGAGSNGKSTTFMFRYNNTSNLWEQIGLMRVARSLCYAVSLPNNELMVVGGNTSNPPTLTNMAEVATVL